MTTITTVRTHGVLSGSHIREGARAAALVAEHHVDKVGTVSDAALAREDVRRAFRRACPAAFGLARAPKGTSHFEKIVREMSAQGGDIVVACEFDLDNPEHFALAEWLVDFLDRTGL